MFRNSSDAAMNVIALSDKITWGVDLRLVKREKDCKIESTVKSDTTSRCTAQEDAHVKRHMYAFATVFLNPLHKVLP